jgi:hypothetical protein
MSIFSIWKYLPVPDGGALFLKNADLPRDDSRQTTAPPRLLIAKTLMVKLVHEVLYRLPRWLYDPAKKKAAMRETENGNPDELEFPAEIGNWAMSGFSSFVATRVDHNSIRDRRIRNYSILDEHFETRDEIRPLFAALRNGSCPLFFPIWVADPADFTRHHYQHGGWCAPYWLATHPLLAKRSFPFEADLRKNVLVLPLHQDLKDRDMLRIADIVNRWQPD